MARLRQEFEIIVGDDFALDNIDGEVRSDHFDTTGATVTTMAVVEDGKATFETPALGRHYLAIRKDEDSRWTRLGTLEVVALIDAHRERLEMELTDLNKRVSELEAIQYMVGDPAGVSITRVNLLQLRSARGRAETRLADYIRAKAGQPPAFLS